AALFAAVAQSRLWHERRIAGRQQISCKRSEADMPRVSRGDATLKADRSYGEDDDALHAITVCGAALRNRPHGGSANCRSAGCHVSSQNGRGYLGHLPELNGKFKLRATEFTFAPGGYIGVHHHIGPGIRYVISGELTFAEGGQETVYKAGEYYY